MLTDLIKSFHRPIANQSPCLLIWRFELKVGANLIYSGHTVDTPKLIRWPTDLGSCKIILLSVIFEHMLRN